MARKTNANTQQVATPKHSSDDRSRVESHFGGTEARSKLQEIQGDFIPKILRIFRGLYLLDFSTEGCCESGSSESVDGCVYTVRFWFRFHVSDRLLSRLAKESGESHQSLPTGNALESARMAEKSE